MITKKISHFGILVHDAEAATKLWTEAFGLQKFDDRRIDVEGIRSIFVSVEAPGTKWSSKSWNRWILSGGNWSDYPMKLGMSR